MPNIREFQTPALGLRPTETGISATAAAARRVGAEYNEAGAAIAAGGQSIAHAGKIAGEMYVEYQGHQEISAGAPALAAKESTWTDAWNNRVRDSDPADPTIQARFIQEHLEPEIEDFKKGFSTEKGQQWAEARTSQFRQHMYNKTSADMATMAGQAAKVGFQQMTNAASNTARNDPTDLDYKLKTFESDLNIMVDSNPNLKGTMAGKVKSELKQHAFEEIIKNAALGHIEKTGEVPEWTSSPEYSKYVNGAELKQFAQAAKNYKNLMNSEARSARIMQEHLLTQDFNRRVNELEGESIPKNVGDPPTLPENAWDRLRELAKHPGAGLPGGVGRLKTTIQQFETLANRLDKPEPRAAVSRAEYMRLTRKISGIDGERMTDPKEIYESSDRLTVADFNKLRAEFESAKTPGGESIIREREHFFKQYESVIDQNRPFTSTPDGLDRQYRAMADARRVEEQLRKEGKDPHEVYNADSAYFFGRAANMIKYADPNMQKQMQDLARKQGVVTPAPVRPSVMPAEKVTPPAQTQSGLKQQIFDERFKGAFRPPADWDFSPSRQQYRSPDGVLYDTDGNRIKK